MQRVWTLTGIALLLGLCGSALADPVPYSARITIPEVEVRSGPSLKYYATSRLRQGAPVRVVAVQGEWLAIEPPAPDSFDWIHTRFIEQQGIYAWVRGDDVPVLIGSAFYP